MKELFLVLILIIWLLEGKKHKSECGYNRTDTLCGYLTPKEYNFVGYILNIG